MAKGLSTEEILLRLDQEDPEDDIDNLLGEESSGDESDLEDEMPPKDVIPRHRIPQEKQNQKIFIKGNLIQLLDHLLGLSTLLANLI